MSRLGVTIPSRLGDLAGLAENAGAADLAGFDSAWVIELYRNPFAMLYGMAPATGRIQLGTGIAAALSRSPFEAANAAADVDEISAGRAIVGLGLGSPELLAGFHSTQTAKPLAEMREYLTCMRRAWSYLGTGEVNPFTGTHFWFDPPPMNPWGLRALARPEIPIYLAAISAGMTRLAGEIGDGWFGYLATPNWIRQRTRPWLEQGAARSGRDLSDFDLAVETICSVSTDRDEAYRRARIQTGFYTLHPVSTQMIEFAGLETERDQVLDAVHAKGLDGLEDTPDGLVEAFSITGTPEEARQKLAHFQTEISHVILHTPYVPPLSATESQDAFDSIVNAFAQPS